jgi:hypothetical protein
MPKNNISHLYENSLAKNSGDGVCILHCFKAVKNGGRMALVVPEGVLFRRELKEVRKHLLDNAKLEIEQKMIEYQKDIIKLFEGKINDKLTSLWQSDKSETENKFVSDKSIFDTLIQRASKPVQQ